ncbi:NACHT C-terminal alpha/beta 1 domain-containing protein [Nostoc sp.]|uniref:NACHT C-terminal alpha/beta 1 domain-containing protein n=1 Tax=Nostoc sp. TaxID=1180 RepID=UPI002FFBE8F4
MQSRNKINKDIVDKALEEILTPALKPFIERKMKEKYGNNWLQNARLGLQEYHIEGNDLNWNDPQVVLKLILNHWNDVFRKPQRFDHSQRCLVSELLDVRNKVKHNDLNQFDYDYTFRALDSMERLLTAIDDKKAAQEVKQLKQKLGSLPSTVQIKKTSEVAISSQPGPVINYNQSSVNTNNIDWKQVCHTILEKQQESQQIRRKATAMGFEVNIHVPLGLVERKQQQRRNENVEREQVYQLQKEAITKIYAHKEFLEQVITQRNAGKNKHIAIVGEPGAGKTTLLSAIASYIKNENQDLIICISLASLQGMTLEDYLLKKWLPEAMGLVNTEFISTPEIENQLITRFRKGGIWLLLDGVDEMGASSPVQALAKISRELRGWPGQARVVLTCRLNVWDANTNNNILIDFQTYKTQEFQSEEVEEFIEKWFTCAENIQRGKELQAKLKELRQERIRELVKNPLRLALLCQIFYKNGQGELPETKAQLYEIFTRYFYEWKSDVVAQELIDSYELQQELHQALGKLALAGINSNCRFRLKASLAVQEIGEKLFKLACDVGWLNLVDRDAGNDEPVYALFHPNFQEYFAALVIDNWHYFLNHVPQNPEDGIYHIFEPQWQEVILLWFGKKVVCKADQDQKEEFINGLFVFKDACNSFYRYQAIALASTVIIEYKDCSIAENIVWSISFWVVGCFNEQEQQWQDLPLYIQNFARKALRRTNSILAVECLESLIEDKLRQEGKIKLLDIECLGLIDPENNYAITILIHLLKTSQDWSVRQEAARILGEISFGNSEVINALLQVLRTTVHDELAASPDLKAESESNSISELDQLLTRSKILNNKPELNFRASESLYKIDPGNPEAIKALINLSCWSISAWCTYDNAISLLQQIGLHESEAISELRKKLQCDNQSVRGAAAEIFAKVEPNNQEAIDILIELLCKGSQIMYESEDFFTGDKTTEIGEDYRNHAEQALIAVGVDNLIIINKLINLLYSSQETETSLKVSNILAKIGTGNLKVIYALSDLLKNDYDERIHQQMAENLGIADPGNTEATDALIHLLINSEDESTCKNVMWSLKKISVGNDKAIATVANLLQNSEDYKTWQQALETLEKIAINTHNMNAINVLTMLLGYSQYEDISYTAADILLLIDPGNSRATEVLSQWFPPNMQSGFAKDLWKNLHFDKLPTKIFNENLNSESIYMTESKEDVWYCAKNMSYSEFYRVWHSQSSLIQNLETQLTDISSILNHLQTTDKTHSLTLNLKTLQDETDISAIAQGICTRIYQQTFSNLEIIPEVNNAFQLERIILPIKKYLQKENIALIINSCETNQAVITFCRKLTDVLHIAFITDQPLNAPLRGFPRNQANLLNAIQTWINEIE